MRRLILLLLFVIPLQAQITAKYRFIYDTLSHSLLTDSLYEDWSGTITYPAYIHDVRGYNTIDSLEYGLKEIGKSYNHPELPATGMEVKAGEYYEYEGRVYLVRQTHFVTIYAPEDVPALFSVYRESEGVLEWIANENVVIGDQRTYNGETYECIQSHMTLEGWEPPNTPALWQVVSGEECPEWVQPTGAHDAYNTGDCVTYNGKQYVSLIDGNVWSPSAYPQGWEEQ